MSFNYEIALNYLLCFLASPILLNILTKGFILAWWRTFRSRGKLVLLKIRNPADNYWTTAVYSNGTLEYKTRKRRGNPNPSRTIPCDNKLFENAINRDWGITWLEVDDEKSVIFYKDMDHYKSAPTNNPEKYDEIIQTALDKPSKQEGMFDARTRDIIMIAGFILILIACYFIYDKLGKMDNNMRLVYDSVNALKDSLVVAK